MYNGKVRVPLVSRTPMGGIAGTGLRIASASKSICWACRGRRCWRCIGLRGLIFALSDAAAQVDQPTLVVENRTATLYGQRTDAPLPEGWGLRVTRGAFPTAGLSPRGDADLTVLTYGGHGGVRVETAAVELNQREELPCELVIPTRLYPLDLEPILDSVRRTGRLLIVEEGQGFCGFGSEVLAELMEDPRAGR